MGGEVISMEFAGYEETVDQCLEAAGAARVIADGRPVMLKPNLVTASPFPVTTSPLFCEAVIAFVRRHTDAPIVIAEGCGDVNLETPEVFARLGYLELARRLSISLLDLNRLPLRRLTNRACSVYQEMWLPDTVFDHVLISLPVLKAHSLCRFTGSMKNMMGLAPPEHYSGRCGIWKKAAFHDRLNESIMDLNQYRSPDFTVMDATVGLSDNHLGSSRCEPPVNRILAGRDARAVDREAAGLLGMNWFDIFHLV
ncbi:MAG: DUF362 domain-containing protein [Pseudomonadota bacterium]